MRECGIAHPYGFRGPVYYERLDCQRRCKGLPPVWRRFWVRAGHQVGERVAASVLGAGGQRWVAHVVVYGGFVLALALLALLIVAILNVLPQ